MDDNEKAVALEKIRSRHATYRLIAVLSLIAIICGCLTFLVYKWMDDPDPPWVKVAMAVFAPNGIVALTLFLVYRKMQSSLQTTENRVRLLMNPPPNGKHGGREAT